MAQVGSFVPALVAKLHVLDGVHTRMGSSDSIQLGRITFLEELSEASHIIHNCTPRSLIILDELGRGTSTHVGVTIAYATLQHLLKQIICMVLFVTHYLKIVKEIHAKLQTRQKRVLITVIKMKITFLYKLVPGMSDRSFGLNVARLAQLPTSCISRAAVMAAKLEAMVNSRTGTQLVQDLFTETDSIQNKGEVQKNYASKTGYYSGEDLTEAYSELFQH